MEELEFHGLIMGNEIIINTNCDEETQIYTFFHELAHYRQDEGVLTGLDNYQTYMAEQWANINARMLYVQFIHYPYGQLDRFYKDEYGDKIS